MEAERSSLKLSAISWTPVWLSVTLCVGALFGFISALDHGHANYYLPFISETGALSPDSCIFSFALFLGSAVGSMIVGFRNLVLRNSLSQRRKLRKISDVATVCGIISMIGMAGVAATPVSTVLWAHLMAAGIHFMFAFVYMFLQAFIQYKIKEDSKLKRVRIALCGLLAVLLLLLIIIFPIGFFRWNKLHDIEPALKMPNMEGFGLVFAAAFFEWTSYATFLAFILTFLSEFRQFDVQLQAVPKDSKDIEAKTEIPTA